MQKNVIMLLLLTCLLVFFKGKAQTFLPLPTENAEWSRLLTVLGDNDPIYTTHHYTPVGDTIIQNKKFTKLYTNTGKAFNIDSAQYIGAYINELGRVFFLDKGEINPRLLYNFNVSIGWVYITFRNCDTSSIGCRFNQLTSIDTVIYNDDIKRLRYNFNWLRKDENGTLSRVYSHSWIEGIGSTLGFFPDPSNTLFLPVTPQVFLDLLCFKQNDTLIYTHPRLYKGNCYVDIISDVKDLNDPDIVNIYPNPTFEKLFIQHDLNLSKNTTNIILIDVVGRVVLKKPLEASLVQLDISNISPGIYFAQIVSKEGRVSVCKKIIKSN
ncbi:T9SS type A sorting domain-containing protein [Haliscomenobacter sp.]|uniref:T9SS type A sorting domain-containing protein n=1 Tax=Haliscomenobacter sp. TaxID=2717303 RepID=UPI0035946752